MNEPARGSWWSWKVILFLVVVNLCGGMALRMLVTGRGAQGPAGRQAGPGPKGGPSVWTRLLGALNPKGEGLRSELRRLFDMFSEKDEKPVSPRTPAGEVDYRPQRLPEESNEPPAQKAARLWQGGVLATRQGDYPWAIRQFKSCLEADPRSEGCKTGLAEAQRRLEWNKRTGKSR